MAIFKQIQDLDGPGQEIVANATDNSTEVVFLILWLGVFIRSQALITL
jgi:hypothetical protein